MSRIPDTSPNGTAALDALGALPEAGQASQSSNASASDIAPLELTPPPAPLTEEALEAQHSDHAGPDAAPADAADAEPANEALQLRQRVPNDLPWHPSSGTLPVIAESVLLNAAQTMLLPESTSLLASVTPLSPEEAEKFRADERNRQQQAEQRRRHERTRQQINAASEKSALASRKAASEMLEKQAMPVRIESHTELVQSVLIDSAVKVLIEPHTDIRHAAESLERYMPYVAVVNAITVIDLYIGTRVAEFQR